jgi:hypothetical protein
LSIALAIIGVLVGGIALWGYLTFRTRKHPDQIEPLGPFGLVTLTTEYIRGWNEGKLGRSTTEHYSLQYRGQPFIFPGKSGMFGDDTVEYRRMNSLITFPTTEPALVVNVGDPNNSSFYYLVREVNGNAVAQHVADGRGGISAQWLDPPPEATPTISDVALHRGAMAPGGRWLLLGDYTVLDTRTLEHFTFAYHKDAGHNQFKPPMELSPDQRSFVRFGSTSPPENKPVLIVYDFKANSSYLLPLSRTFHRYTEWEEIDLAWLHHYFKWERNGEGIDLLVPNAGVAPLPYHGRLSHEPDTDYREYRLQPVLPAMVDSLAQFLEQEFAAQRLPPKYESSSGYEFRVGEHPISVSGHEDHASVYHDHGTPSGPTVEAIASRFDAALKTGRYDALFFDPKE